MRSSLPFFTGHAKLSVCTKAMPKPIIVKKMIYCSESSSVNGPSEDWSLDDGP